MRWKKLVGRVVSTRPTPVVVSKPLPMLASTGSMVVHPDAKGVAPLHAVDGVLINKVTANPDVDTCVLPKMSRSWKATFRCLLSMKRKGVLKMARALVARCRSAAYVVLASSRPWAMALTVPESRGSGAWSVEK